MAVSIGCVGELYRNERRAFGAVEAGPASENSGNQVAADQLGQEFIDDHPLVVPGQRAPRRLEQGALVRAARSKPVDDPVVRPDERDLHLVHENVRVVARVGDNCDSFLVSGDIAVEVEKFRRVTAQVQVRRARRPGPVERLKVGPCASQVRQRSQFSVRRQGRAVCGEVVSDELAEKWPASLDAGISCRTRTVISGGHVAKTPGCADPAQDYLVSCKSWQVEHSPVTPDCVNRHIEPVRCQTSFTT